jgi:hypothetical protein
MKINGTKDIAANWEDGELVIAQRNSVIKFTPEQVRALIRCIESGVDQAEIEYMAEGQPAPEGW